MAKPVLIAGMQRFCKTARLAFRLTVLWCRKPGMPANDVCPKSNAWIRYVPPQHIEPLVPIIELRVVAALKACATQAKGLQVVPLNRAHDSGCHMCAVGNALCSGDFPAQMPRLRFTSSMGVPRSLRGGGDRCGWAHR